MSSGRENSASAASVCGAAYDTNYINIRCLRSEQIHQVRYIHGGSGVYNIKV